jgi:molybdenum cofactor biosynthesis enzyme MoaA
MDAQEIDLSSPLRAGASLETVKALLEQAIQNKPRGHRLSESAPPQDRTMAQIGG